MMMMDDDGLKAYLKRRDALFNNPTLEGATEFFKAMGEEKFSAPHVPLAALHKARLQWLNATDEQLAESKQWLLNNKYLASNADMPPLTPETRDEQRQLLGLAPLRKN